jgi:hypothetical protein
MLISILSAFPQFGGHLLTPVLVFLTPLTAYALNFGCAEATGGALPRSLSSVVDRFLTGEWIGQLWDTKAAAAYLAWYAFCVAAWAILPGEWVEGVSPSSSFNTLLSADVEPALTASIRLYQTELRDGTRKQYKINGKA